MNNIIELLKDDITKLNVDAVVNAANNNLNGGGGVDGAIHKAAGMILNEECKVIIKKIGVCATGEAVITSAGKMLSNYIIHTVGPVWMGGNKNESQLLAKCYKNTLKLTNNYKIKTIAFPNISTGIYSFPKLEAADIAIKEANEYLKYNNNLNKIIFCCFDDDNFEIYKKILHI